MSARPGDLPSDDGASSKSFLHRKVNAPVALAVIVLVLLFAASFVDSRLNVPVVSKITCSLKGGTWTDGSVEWGIAAGCYAVSQP